MKIAEIHIEPEMVVVELTLPDSAKGVIQIKREDIFNWITGETQREKDSESVGTSKEVPTESETVEGFDPEGFDLFETKDGIGGTLQDAQDGRKKIDEIRTWLKKNNFSYNNFCLYLSELKTLAGKYPLSRSVIGNKSDGKPSLFYLALRYYTFWKSQQDSVAKEYKQFLFNQVREMGYTIEKAVEIFEGEVIDPAELPPGTEVAV